MGAAEVLDKDVLVQRLPNLIDEASVQSVERQTAQWLLDPAVLHVFDFSDVLVIDQRFYRVISVYRRTLTKNGKHLASIGLRPNLLVTASQMGLSATFGAVDNIEKAKQLAGLIGAKPKMKIDSGTLSPFIEGTITTLETQASVKVQTGKPFIKNGTEEPVAIAGVITMNNAELPGSIALCFSTKVFLGIYESMVGETHTEISAETQDAAGELLNIIYGFAKTKLKADGFAIDMAIPVIMSGEKLQLQIGEKGKSIIIPFTCVYGTFHLEVYFKKS